MIVKEIWSNEDLPLVKEVHVTEYLNKLNKHKHMGPETMYPNALRYQD